MKKITLYIPDFRAGGAERVAINLAAALGRAGFQITLLVNLDVGALKGAVSEEIEIVSLAATRTIYAFPKLVRYIRRHKPDVLISLLSFGNISAIWANKLAFSKTRIFVTLHNNLLAQSKTSSS